MITDDQIVEAIRKLSEKGYPPTVREIKDLVGISSSYTMHVRLIKLKDSNILGWEPAKPRTIRVVKDT